MIIRILKQYCQCQITHVDIEVHGGADLNKEYKRFKLNNSSMEVRCGECGTAVAFEVKEWGQDVKCMVCNATCDIEITAKCRNPDPEHSHFKKVLDKYAGISFFYGLKAKKRIGK